MPHSVQETSLSSLCPTLSHQSSVAGGYVKLSEEAIDGVHVAFPYHFIDSIQVRHCAVDWRETVSDGLTRCARLVGAPPKDPWGAYWKPPAGGKAPRKALPVKQPSRPPKRKWKEECQAMSDAMKAIEESTLTKNDIREEIEAKKAAEERHMQTRERVGKRVRNSSEQVNELFNEFKWRTEKVTSNGLVIDDDSDSD